MNEAWKALHPHPHTSGRSSADGSLMRLVGRSPQVVHKAVLQFDEKGMEAAAPTTRGRSLHAASKPVTVHFNRPFIVMVFDHFTWSSLFLGKIVNLT